MSVSLYQSQEIKVLFSEEIYEKIHINATSQDKSVEEYVEKVVEKEVTVFKLAEGYSYKSIEKQLINPSGQIVTLTRKEEKVLEILIENCNETVSLDVFFEVIWNNKTTGTTLYSLRNFIKSIRDKTTYGIIHNVSGIGYSLQVL